MKRTTLALCFIEALSITGVIFNGIFEAIGFVALRNPHAEYSFLFLVLNSLLLTLSASGTFVSTLLLLHPADVQ